MQVRTRTMWNRMSKFLEWIIFVINFRNIYFVSIISYRVVSPLSSWFHFVRKYLVPSFACTVLYQTRIDWAIKMNFILVLRKMIYIKCNTDGVVVIIFPFLYIFFGKTPEWYIDVILVSQLIYFNLPCAGLWCKVSTTCLSSNVGDVHDMTFLSSW